MNENGELSAEAELAAQVFSDAEHDEAVDLGAVEAHVAQEEAASGANIRTLDGELAGDEFASDAINYQVLLGKIDVLLEKLKLDA